MSTKRDPGKFDCYARAKPDEPMFVLLARDPWAPDLVDVWAGNRAADIEKGVRPTRDAEMVSEAMKCADDMRAWRKANWPQRKNDGTESPTPQGIPDAWLVIGAEYRRSFDSKTEAEKTAATWGKVLPLYRGDPIPPHAFTGNAPGVVGADNCQICGVWFEEHSRPPRTE